MVDFRKLTDRIDMFGQPTPTFNINGITEIKSQFGFMTTMVAIMVLLAYAISKGVIRMKKHNPHTTEAIHTNFYDSSFRFNLKEQNFKIAVGVYDYLSREPKNDPNYVRW